MNKEKDGFFMKKVRLALFAVCLMFSMLMVPGELCLAKGEDPVQYMNSSGNLNIRPAVDPFGEGGSFSAVLYNNHNGLPTSEANAIAQTDDGFIWIGSYSGLLRYDGKTFERVEADTPVSNVRCLFKDSLNRLWIGSNDAGFLMMENGQFRKWGRGDGLESLVTRNFAEDSAGYIYIGTASGLVIINPDMELSIKNVGNLQRSVHNLRRDGEGKVYALTREGDLACFYKGEQLSIMNSEDCPIENINCMLPDPERPGWFWLGTMDSKVFYGEAANGFHDAREQDLGELLEPERLEEIDGRIWVCARNGIGRLDEDGIALLEDVPMDNSVQNVMTDYQGNLWFGSTRQGVMKIVPNQFEDLFARWELPPQVINSTCLYDSVLFLATDEGLLAVEDGELIDSIPLTSAETASGKKLEAKDLLSYLKDYRLRSVIRDSRGRLWISPWNGEGLVRYAEGEMVVYTPEDGMASKKCRVVSECKDGSILVAHSGGLSVIRDDQTIEVYREEEGILNRGVLTVTEGFDGEYVIGTDGGGMFIVRPDGVTHIGFEDGLGSDVVMRVSKSRGENVIWIVTGNSLAFMTPDYQVTVIRKFPYANNYDLYENSKGELWVLSSNGIYVASVKQLLANDAIETVHYNSNNGLPYVATANSYSELTEDGDLYIAGTSGVTRVNIEKPYETETVLKMAVPFVDADDVRIWPDSEAVFTIPSETHKLTINGFVFNYAMQDPKLTYCLKGFDKEPVTVSCSALSPVDYTNLRGGEYLFSMILEDGTELSALIRKERTFYEQPWFWILAGAILVLFEIWLIRFIMKRQALRIEKKKDEERIAGDLRLASTIQSSVLPDASGITSEEKRFDLFASMVPAKEVGGDFYDYFLVDDDHLAMVIADVSGKGIPAALFMMVSKALIKNQLMTGLAPAEALTSVNLQLCENNDATMFVTVWLAVLDLSTGEGLACNAGHENPCLRREGGRFELLNYKHSVSVGATDLAKYVNRPFKLSPGDCLFVYTDGVPEAHDADEQMFGTERLEAALNQDSGAMPKELIGNVQTALKDFVKDAPQFDDVTMLALKYNGIDRDKAKETDDHPVSHDEE